MHDLFKKYGLKHLSISQVKTIKRSPFAWVCEKILKRRSPNTEATTLGSFVHDNFERWLTDRVEDPKEVYISEEAKEFYVSSWDAKVFKFWKDYREQCKVWPEKDGVEMGFSITLDDQLPPFIGKIDVVGRSDGILHIQDHKTVGCKRYAYSTPEDLALDPQLNLYAHALLEGEEVITLQHNQLFKKIKRKPVNVLSADVNVDHVSKVVEEIRLDSLEVIEILKKYDELGIEGFAESVKDQYKETRWDFGGCPHWDFHQECLRKHFTNKNEVSYTDDKKGEDTMPEDLHLLVGKARNHFSEQGLVKFDLADAVVEAVMNNLKKTSVKAIFVRDGEGGDLIYNQLLNRAAEENISIFKKVR